MPLIIESPDMPERSETITAAGMDVPDPHIGGTGAQEANMANDSIRVQSLKDHASGADWHPKDSEYETDPLSARRKAEAGLVKILDGKAKSAGPSANKAAAPEADKATKAKAAPKKKAPAKAKAKGKG